MSWVYLSPHLDDAVFSCGGLIWEQVQQGEAVQVWTICAGSPPEGDLPPFAQSLHARWGTGPETVAIRRKEDQAACQHLGVEPRWEDVPDSIYRRSPQDGQALYASGAAIFGALHPGDDGLRQQLIDTLSAELPAEASLIAPLTIGNHVDHQLVRQVAESLNRPLFFFADFPYVINNESLIGYHLPPGAKGQVHTLSPAALTAWQDATAFYASQLSTFWSGEAAMRQSIQGYYQRLGGIEIWQSPQ